MKEAVLGLDLGKCEGLSRQRGAERTFKAEGACWALELSGVGGAQEVKGHW